MSRHFLFLQGPLSFFFYRFAKSLEKRGVLVSRIQFCGGDVFFWPGRGLFWQGKREDWAGWIGKFLETEHITDLVLIGAWRPLHREAVLLARARNIAVWVYEEGYLRPGFVTLEQGGVNRESQLPRKAALIRERARLLSDCPDPLPSSAPNPMLWRVLSTCYHHVGNFLLWPLFFRYKTHRPYCIGKELLGHIPRYLTRHQRRRASLGTLRRLFHAKTPFYFVPLQLDSDSQIRLNSPFGSVPDFLACVVASFAMHAPKECALLFKNHPLDNGLIDYARLIPSLGEAFHVRDRLFFVESVNTRSILERCRGCVLCNSTLGLSALREGCAVYCLGSAIYAMEGLGVSGEEMPLSEFWTNPRKPDSSLVEDFCRVVRSDALLRGNFFSRDGIEDLIAASLKRMGLDGV